MDDLSLTQSIGQLIEKVPEPIREFIFNDLGRTTELLMDKHLLHIDQGGVLERELLLMLLGQENPEGFSKALEEANVPPLMRQNILSDVNEMVFKKLRAAEQGTVDMKPAAPEPKPEVPAPVYQAPAAPIFQAPVPPQPVAQPIPEPVIPSFQPAPAPIPVGMPTPVMPVASAVPDPAPVSAVRTMQADMAMMKSGGFPMPAKPASPWEQPAFSQPVAQPVQQPSAPTIPQPLVQPSPIEKSYGVDPYREPVE